MRKKTLADGTVRYTQSRKLLLILSSALVASAILVSMPILLGDVPISSSFFLIIAGVPAVALQGWMWRLALRASLEVSEKRVVWDGHSVDLSDIESVGIIEETTGSSMWPIEQLVLALSVRGQGEVRCRALSMFIGTADKQQLIDAKGEIEKRVAALTDRGAAADGGPLVDES